MDQRKEEDMLTEQYCVRTEQIVEKSIHPRPMPFVDEAGSTICIPTHLGFLVTGEAGLEEVRPWTAELPENAAMDGQDESSTILNRTALGIQPFWSK
jgi:hypothetical protein